MEFEKVFNNRNNNLEYCRRFVALQNHIIYIRINNRILDDKMLCEIIDCVCFAVEKYSFSKFPIIITMKNTILVYKLYYVILECILNSLICDYNYKIILDAKFIDNIITSGIRSSPLFVLSNKKDSSSIYAKKFNFDIYKNHYRKLLKYNDYNEEKLGQIYDELINFQKSFSVNYDCIDQIAEVVVELAGNAIEHTSVDCLIDIDIAPNYINQKTGENCIGINICVLSFSDCLLGDELKHKIIDELEVNANERYLKVKKAYDYHSSFFDEKYDAEDFFNISVFQHRISGRTGDYLSGGTGLTKLVKSIEEKADGHSCFVISGNHILELFPKYLSYNDDKWIGFNSNNDYLNSLPDLENISRSKFNLQGTAYNLNFIMKENN